jgi:uncharacterized protein involved in high-affinity Fe2+ transport
MPAMVNGQAVGISPAGRQATAEKIDLHVEMELAKRMTMVK